MARSKIGSKAWAREKRKREGKAKSKRPDLGRTKSEAAQGESMRAAGHRVSRSNTRATSDYVAPLVLPPAPSRGDYGRTGPVSVDPALLSNAATGLSEVEQSDLRKALTGSRDSRTVLEATPDMLTNAAEIAATVAPIPGVAVVRGALTARRVAQAAKGTQKGAQAAKGASKASKAASKVKSNRATSKATKATNKAERKTAKKRIKSERSKMTVKERTKDRAKDVKTRTQARVYDNAGKIVAGSGGAGAAGAGAREAGKKGKTSSAVNSLAAPAVAPVSGAVPATTTGQRIASAPVEIGRATVESPGTVAKATVVSARDALTGFPAAIAQSVSDPAGAAEMMIDDIEYRYGPLVEGDKELFRERVKEGGLTPYALDALILTPPAGRAAGALARSGKLGDRAEGFMNAERPGLMKAPGKEPARQKNAKSVQGRAAQKVLDRTRARTTNRRADFEDPVAVQARDSGAVVPIRQNHTLSRGVAEVKARARQVMLGEQGRMLREAGKLVQRIPRENRTAIKWALALGIRTADQARVELPLRIEAIKEARGEVVYGRRQDNIPEIEDIIARADEIFTPEFNESIGSLRRLEKKLAVGDPVREAGARKDPALDIEQAALRRYAQQAEHMGIERFDGESNAGFVGRVRAEARERGLDEAGYFPSELSRRKRFSQSASGGTRHSERTKKYEGELFRQGIENNDPSIMIRGFQRNIKRKNSWQMVSDIFEASSFPWSRDAQGHGISMAEAIKEMGRRGIDENQVVFVNPGLLRQAASKDMAPGTAQSRQATQLGNQDNPEIMEAIKSAAQMSNQAPDTFVDMKGWVAVPKQVMDELEASMKTGKIGRVADVAMSQMSKYMLAYNTGWATFQTISNGVQIGLAGVGPLDMIRGQILFHRLSEAERDKVGAAVGVSQAQQLLERPHMGAAAQAKGHIGGAVQGYQLWREGKWGRAMRHTNPITAFFRVAQIPENVMRRGLAYNKAKKMALESMNENVKVTHAAINRIHHVMKMDPKKQVVEIMKDPAMFDDLAKGVQEFLGDYTTFTAKERAIFKRSIPFYSWIRFATKFAFFTLPVKRPITAGILYQLGRLETSEVRELLGNNLPWGLGKMFFEDGKLSIDAYRGNPVLSAVTDFQDPQDLMGFLPPYLQLLTNQIYDKDYFTGDDLTVEGETTGRRFVDAGLEGRARILVNSVAGIFAPYRAVSEIAFEGTPQSSDALPWSPRPKQYKPGSGQIRAREQEEAYDRNGGAEGVLLKQAAPFWPQSTEELLQTADYVNAETEAERARIEENAASARGESTGNVSDYMDELRATMQADDPVADYMDELKTEMGQ